MSTLIISVALCTYNSSRYLQAELESMASQTRFPDEVVVCDDGSQDNTLELLEQFRKNASFPVRIFRNAQHLGSTKNFEQAIAFCQGEFIALADHDDLWYPNKLQLLSEVLAADPNAGYVFADADVIDDEGKPVGATLWQKQDVRYLPRTGFLPQNQVTALLKVGFPAGCTMMFRSDLKEIVLPISSRWIHDFWISLLASMTGRYGIAVSEPLMAFRLHASQAVGVRPRIWKLLPFLLTAPRNLWAEEKQKFMEIRERLYGDPNLNRCKAEELELLDEKILHLGQRASARSAKGWQRCKIVLSEARTGRYGQFSFSWQSALRDLCL